MFRKINVMRPFVWMLLMALLTTGCLTRPAENKGSTPASSSSGTATSGSSSGSSRAGSTAQQPKPAQGEPLKIGAVWSMTGPNAKFGTWQTTAARTAIEEINAAGGIQGRPLDIIIEDSKGQAQEGVAAFTKLAEVDKVPAILVMISGVVLATMPLANKYKVVLMDTASTNPAVREGGPYVWSDRPKADLVGAAAAEFAKNILNVKNAAFLATNIEFGRGWVPPAQKRWEELGGKTLAVEWHEDKQTDFRSQITKVKGLGPELLFMPGSYQPLALLSKQAWEQDFKPYLFGTNFENPDFLKLAGPAAQGALYLEAGWDPTDQSPIVQEYIKKYRERTGEAPEYAGANVYDAIKMIAAAANKHGFTADGIRTGLRELKDFPGVAGPSTFDDKNIVIKPVKVYQYQGDRWVKVAERSLDGKWTKLAEVKKPG